MLVEYGVGAEILPGELDQKVLVRDGFTVTTAALRAADHAPDIHG